MPYIEALIIKVDPRCIDERMLIFKTQLIDTDTVRIPPECKLAKSNIKLMTTAGIQHYVIHEIYHESHPYAGANFKGITNVYNFRKYFIRLTPAFIIYIIGSNESYSGLRRLTREEVKRFTFALQQR